MNFAEKVAVVTGGAQGIGRAYCIALLNVGMKVCIFDVKEDVAGDFIDKLPDVSKDRTIFLKCDVTSFTQFKDAFDKVISRFGRVDLVVNNAAIFNEHDWEKMVEVNLIGVIHGIKLGFDYMDINKGGYGGVIINTASNASFDPFPLGPVYSGCKHGIVGLTKSYGTDFYLKKTGVKVNAVCPGPVETDLFNEFPQMCVDEEEGRRNNATVKPIKPEDVAMALIHILTVDRNGVLLRVEADVPYHVE